MRLVAAILGFVLFLLGVVLYVGALKVLGWSWFDIFWGLALSPFVAGYYGLFHGIWQVAVVWLIAVAGSLLMGFSAAGR